MRLIYRWNDIFTSLAGQSLITAYMDYPNMQLIPGFTFPVDKILCKHYPEMKLSEGKYLHIWIIHGILKDQNKSFIFFLLVMKTNINRAFFMRNEILTGGQYQFFFPKSSHIWPIISVSWQKVFFRGRLVCNFRFLIRNKIPTRYKASTRQVHIPNLMLLFLSVFWCFNNDIFSLIAPLAFHNVKGTRMQVWKSSYIFLFTSKQYPENFAFVNLRILELFTRKVCEFLKKCANF